MKRAAWFLTIVVVAIATLGAEKPAAIAPPPLLPHRPVSFSQSFRLLLERNIFDASRSPYVGNPSVISSTTTAPQSTLTLTGLVLEDGAYSAFIEDSRTNTTTKYKIGDTIAGGKITAVQMDFVNLSIGGRTIHINLGQTMAGTNPVASTNPTTIPSSGNDMIERLRQRRLQELHQ